MKRTSLNSLSEFIHLLIKHSKLVIGSLILFCLTACDGNEHYLYPPMTGTMKDIDGNEYKTVKIGEHWWMAENLRVTRLRDGTPIPKAQEDVEWQKARPSYCIYENDVNAPGLLYNFYVISSSEGVAPYGWHIPTDEEWKTLELALGMSADDVNKVNWRGSHEGEKLKIHGPDGWQAFDNIWGTNESGFTALAGSCRLFDGRFGVPGLQYNGFWWTSTLNDKNETKAWYRYLDYKNADVFRYFAPKSYGFSIRCIKN